MVLEIAFLQQSRDIKAVNPLKKRSCSKRRPSSKMAQMLAKQSLKKVSAVADETEKQGNSAMKYGREMNCRLVRAKKTAANLPQIWKPLFIQRFLSRRPNCAWKACPMPTLTTPTDSDGG
jgi:hypothetical protein